MKRVHPNAAADLHLQIAAVCRLLQQLLVEAANERFLVRETAPACQVVPLPSAAWS